MHETMNHGLGYLAKSRNLGYRLKSRTQVAVSRLGSDLVGTQTPDLELRCEPDSGSSTFDKQLMLFYCTKNEIFH